MSFLPDKPNKENISEFIDSLGIDTYCLISDHFRNLHSLEVLENFPLPKLADQERTDLNEYLKAGCNDCK